MLVLRHFFSIGHRSMHNYPKTPCHADPVAYNVGKTENILLIILCSRQPLNPRVPKGILTLPLLKGLLLVLLVNCPPGLWADNWSNLVILVSTILVSKPQNSMRDLVRTFLTRLPVSQFITSYRSLLIYLWLTCDRAGKGAGGRLNRLVALATSGPATPDCKALHPNPFAALSTWKPP